MNATPSLHGVISKTSFGLSILFITIVSLWIYWEFTTNLNFVEFKLILQSDVAGKMDFSYKRAGTLQANRLCQQMAAAIFFFFFFFAGDSAALYPRSKQ